MGVLRDIWFINLKICVRLLSLSPRFTVHSFALPVTVCYESFFSSKGSSSFKGSQILFFKLKIKVSTSTWILDVKQHPQGFLALSPPRSPPSSPFSLTHCLGKFLLEPPHQLFLQQEHMANQQRTFGERKLALIHPNDGENENVISSFAKV